MSGRLVICATPIGNLSDISERLREALADADVVFAEDTRRGSKLLSAVQAGTPMRSYFEGNEAKRSVEIRELLREGKTVAVISDAGMPGVSDPGRRAVLAAREVRAAVTVIPGPSAVTSTLAVSGFEADRFVFEGFLPRRGADRRAVITGIAEQTRTTVLLASPRRLIADLEDLAGELDTSRGVCVARELTKLHEEVWWGTLEEAVQHWGDRDIRGEVTVAIEGATVPEADLAAALEGVRRRVAEGATLSEAVKAEAADSGVAKNELYRAALES